MIRRNVLIFHTGALGDFVLTWPLGLALGRIYAQSRVMYVTHPSKGAVAGRVLRLDWRDIGSGWHQLHTADPQLDEPQARLLAGAQLIVNFVAGANETWTDNLRRLSGGAPVVSLSPTPPEGWDEHATRYVLSQLSDQPILQSAMEQMLRSIAERGVGYPARKGDAIVIHPGSGSPRKCWPLERYTELIERLKSGGYVVRALLGEAEIDHWPAERIDALRRACPVSTPPSYVDLLDELAAAQTFVGNDSGPAHLAGAIGLPTVALFGSTLPDIWRPWGPKVTTVHNDPITELTVDAVYAAVTRGEGKR